jgi:hypothetical protein
VRLEAADPLECARDRQPPALEQELPCEESAVQLALREHALAHRTGRYRGRAAVRSPLGRQSSIAPPDAAA